MKKALFGERIRNLRSSKGWIQDDLAKKINVSKQTIANWEQGKKFPSPKNIKKLSEALQIPPDELEDLIIMDAPGDIEASPILHERVKSLEEEVKSIAKHFQDNDEKVIELVQENDELAEEKEAWQNLAIDLYRKLKELNPQEEPLEIQFETFYKAVLNRVDDNHDADLKE